MSNDATFSDNDASLVPHPKPPTPPPEPSITNVQPLVDPPPPYPSPNRRPRAGTNRSTRRIAQISGDGLSITTTNPVENDALSTTDDGTETTPLLSPRRRPRTMSHSTVMSTQSLAQTALSLFQADEDDGGSPLALEETSSQSQTIPSSRRARRYFRVLWKNSYYRSLAHLMFINFPFALAAFVYLFVGTLTGTTLLIALPLGAVICWFNLVGARAFARGEISLQTYFHGPLSIQPPNPPNPIFSRPSVDHSASSIEAGRTGSHGNSSFLRNTYEMFTDQTSYQAIFYFLVIKPAITLFLTVTLLIVVPVSFALVLPAPAVLRAVKRIGVWQANVALEGLSRPRL